jgi:hypothetical protein
LPDQQAVFDELFQSVAPTVSDMIWSTMNRGLPVRELAVVVERRSNGRVFCGCARRRSLISNFPREGQLAEPKRLKLAHEMQSAKEDELLILLVIHEDDGLVSVRVQKGRMLSSAS